MAKYLSNGTNLTLILGIGNQVEYLNVDLTKFPNVTMAQLQEMEDEDAKIFFSGVMLTDEEKTINRAIALFERGIGTDVFVRNGDSFYHRGVKDISVPQELFTGMIFAISEGDNQYYNSLVLFWKWCGLNDSPESRQAMFEFLQRNGFTLTDTGLFLSYRQVVDVETTLNGRDYPQLFSFLNEKIQLVMNIWKESPAKHFVSVSEDGVYSLTKNTVVDALTTTILGSLKDVYETAKTATKFTDAHTGTFDIRMGEVVEEVREKCDFNRGADCSKGLHVGSPCFVQGGYFGNVGILVLINPKDVVSVPTNETNKMRVNKYFPIGFIRYNANGKIILPDFKMMADKFTDESIEDLDERLSRLTVKEIGQYRIVPTDISMSVFDQLKTDLAKIDDAIKGRVVKL